MGLSQFDEVQPLQQNLRADNSWGTTPTNTANIPVGRYRIDGILLTSNDVIAHDVDFYYATSGAVREIGSVAVPAGAGYGATPPIDALPLLLGTSTWQLVLPAGDLVLISFEVAITSGQFVDITFFGGAI